MSKDAQQSKLLVRYQNLPPKKYQALERLVEVGLVRSNNDIIIAAQLSKEYGVSTRSLVTWKNQGLDLDMIARSLSMRQLVSRELVSYGMGDESIVALNGFLEKMGSGLSLSYFINPETRLPEITEMPKELVIVLDTLLGVVSELAGTKYPLQRLLHLVNTHYNGNIRQAYADAAADPESFKQRVRARQIARSTENVPSINLDYDADEESIYDNPDQFLKDLNKRRW